MRRQCETPRGLHAEIRTRVHNLTKHGMLSIDMSFATSRYESFTGLVADLMYSTMGLTCILGILYEEWVKDRGIESDLFSLIDLADILAQVS